MTTPDRMRELVELIRNARHRGSAAKYCVELWFNEEDQKRFAELTKPKRPGLDVSIKSSGWRGIDAVSSAIEVIKGAEPKVEFCSEESKANFELMKRYAMNRARGFFIVSGPHRSGKTTLVRSVLSHSGSYALPIECEPSSLVEENSLRHNTRMERYLLHACVRGYFWAENVRCIKSGSILNFVHSPTWVGRRKGGKGYQQEENHCLVVVTMQSVYPVPEDVLRRAFLIELRERKEEAAI